MQIVFHDKGTGNIRCPVIALISVNRRSVFQNAPLETVESAAAAATQLLCPQMHRSKITGAACGAVRHPVCGDFLLADARHCRRRPLPRSDRIYKCAPAAASTIRRPQRQSRRTEQAGWGAFFRCLLFGICCRFRLPHCLLSLGFGFLQCRA